MNDAGYIGTPAINPGMKSVSWIGHSMAFQNRQVLVDREKVRLRYFIEAYSQALRIECARFLGTGGDLTGQSRSMAMREQDAACEGNFLPYAQIWRRQMMPHRRLRMHDKFFFSECQAIRHLRPSSGQES
jgi:hypothetical protein